MIILIFFAFLAGLVTIVAPCILPILPVVLSAGVTGGKQRPLGIVVGLMVSFTFFTLSLSYLTRHLGIDANVLRNLAIIVLLLFGVLLLWPKGLSIFETALSRFLSQAKPNTQRADFLGGVLVGFSLGLVWTPCVGPIIASVIALAATSSVTLASVLITLAYVLGTSIPLLILIYGGQRLLKPIKNLGRITQKLQTVFGLIMIVTALGMLFKIDQTVQRVLLAKLPSSINAGLTQELEQTSLVQDQLKQLKGNTMPSSNQIVAGQLSGLPILGNAPEFTGIIHWLNSDPLTMQSLRGKVVLIDFWTYSCINCLRTLPHVTSWYDTYKDQGLVVIGVHAPEFAFEQNSDNVARAITQNGIHYPVAQDNNYGTWNAFGNQYWPAEYLIDAEGRIRETHFGEGNYDETEANIRSLLMEAKQVSSLPTKAPIMLDLTPNEDQSPETYLGTTRRANYDLNGDPNSLAKNHWTLKGNWQENGEYITSGQSGDSLSYKFIGQDVYLVLNPPAGGATIQVLLDGKSIPDQVGTDVKGGVMTIDTDRLYHLVHLSQTEGSHLLTLIFQGAGMKAFSFTFG